MQTLFNGFILFFVLLFLPAFTKTPFGDNVNTVIFFLIQIGYIVASSKQIRYGYPTSDTYIASMIDSSYSILNRCIFLVGLSLEAHFSSSLSFIFLLFYDHQLYRYIPFLFEIHQIFDWTLSTTSLHFVHWLKVYSAYTTLYDSKCRVRDKQQFLTVQALYYAHDQKEREKRQRPLYEKIFIGGLLVVLLVFVLILPLVLFSSRSPALTAKPIQKAELSISLLVGVFLIAYSCNSQFDDDLIPIYQTNNDILIQNNETDHSIWVERFKSDVVISLLLSSEYSNTEQRVIFPDIVCFGLQLFD